MRFLTLVLSTALSVLSVTAHGQAILTRGNHQDPASLDPHRISTVYEHNIILDLFEGLTASDAHGKPAPAVAQDWRVSDDGLTWTFKLRPDLTWSDGTPLTAADVVYSFQRLMTPATASQYPYLFYGVVNGAAVNRGAAGVESLGVAAPTPDQVTLQLTSPVPYLPELLSNGFAAIVPRHVIEEHGDKWTQPGVMVSNGAFALKEWRPQDRVDLTRNTRFREADKVALDAVIYLPTEDQSAALARFRSGGLDTSMEFPTARTPWLKENLPNETRIADSLITFYLTFNTEVTALSDVRVRRALSLAIDRTIIAGRVLRAGERAASTFVPPSIAGYTSPIVEVLSSDQRRTRARLLLSEAGYGPGNPLRLTFSVSSAEDRRRIAAAIAAMWKPLGVEVTLNNTEGKVLFSKLRTGDFEVGYAGWAADVNDAANFLAILQSQASTSNYARYRNPAYDALLAQAAASADLARRAALLAEAEALMLADAPIAPLFHGVSKNLVAARVTGWVDNAKDVHPSRFLSLAD